jgi:hypothetical protein
MKQSVKVYDIDAVPQTIEEVLEPLSLPRYMVSKADYDALAAELAEANKRIKAQEKVIEIDMREYVKQEAEVCEQQARIAQLEAMIKRYGQHDFMACDTTKIQTDAVGFITDKRLPCTCGFDAARSALGTKCSSNDGEVNDNQSDR